MVQGIRVIHLNDPDIERQEENIEHRYRLNEDDPDDEFEKLKEDQLQENTEVPFKVGESYFIRTVTYFIVGKLTAIKGNFLMMESASWIADTGRFHRCIMNGEFEEIEPVGEVWLNVLSIVDVYPWKHKLPKEPK